MKKKAISTLVVLMLVIPMLTFAVPVSAQVTVPQGPWVDEVDFFREADVAKAIDMLEAGEMHAYYFPISDRDLYADVKASTNLWSTVSYGSYNELTFNPVGPEFPATGKLNPFSVPKIREAINYLVDRDYMAEEICGGLAIPRYLAITPSFPDYARLIDTARALELEYSYNLEKARTIITEEMQKLGASLVGGKWKYKGEDVTLIFLIRTEDERRDMGDYVATQLENLGFTVDRQYKTSAEASPIWIGSDPAAGLWHIYTGGWVTTAISRDQAGNFDFFYTPRGRSDPLWQAYTPDPEFDYIADRLGRRDYTSMEERNELMARALELSMKDSVRVWLVNRVSPWVARNEISVTSDLAGGFYGCWIWPHTIRFKDTVGGTVKIATTQLLNDPWNPVAGSNWIYDQMVIRATYDSSLLPDPFTGLYWPNRIKDADVYVQRGIPVTKTLDWVTLRFVDEIEVPTDAWYGWNATSKEIITTPSGITAKAKVVVRYEDNLFNIKYHDGTNMSLADFIFNFIFTFDRADPASPIYDSAYVPAFNSFRTSFKGFKIISEDPLEFEYYTDTIYPDAEWIVVDAADAFDPEMGYGPSPWHMIAIGWLAEKDSLLAFSSKKADTLDVEWMSYISGPSLPILADKLDEAITTQFVPYEEVLLNYMRRDDAVAKYNALKDWYEDKGHFWVGSGLFYVDSVDTTAKTIVIKANRNHPDKADKWAGFAEPKLPEVSLSAPTTITQSLPANFTITVTFKGQPYATEELDFVKYLIVSSAGKVVSVGAAEPLEDGTWRILLSAADTSLLPIGSNNIQVVASSKLVSIPGSTSGAFTVVTFQDFLNLELSRLRAELETTLTELEELTAQLQDQSNNMQSSLSWLNNLSIGALIIGIIALIAAVAVVLIKFKKK
ncbi:MAG: ABC transporter substrate-binding protein [Candidatus Bathyarchaeota archaeon]|jgi:peptide/nickel transport system substrate-binding protein|nr:ABC transporter substrate-binding protein [Candidatus Bathyarchaeota archaeon]